jgi:imidazole glycerol-phosphate synthase subunit HisH
MCERQTARKDVAEHKGFVVSEKIIVVDYKAGNLASVQKAFAHLGFETQVTEDPEVVSKAEKLVLPGVGNFAAVQRLSDTGLTEAISQRIHAGVPFLGICVGMQWLYEGSTEAPGVAGLGALKGRVARFRCDLKIPHVGWNTIQPISSSRILKNVPEAGFVYYTHSYRCPIVDGVVARTSYGEEFAAVVERDNVYGVQFHPEKSSTVGMQILKNFCEVGQ